MVIIPAECFEQHGVHHTGYKQVLDYLLTNDCECQVWSTQKYVMTTCLVLTELLGEYS
jgi:hypothetical protein